MLVGIDWNSFRKGNLYNAPHVVVFFYCVDTLYIDAESVMSVFQSPLFGKKKTKKTNGNTDHQLELLGCFWLLIACLNTASAPPLPLSDSRTHHPPALYFSLDLGTFQVAVHMNGLTGCHGSCTADTVRLTDISVPARHRHIGVVMTTL